MDRPAAASRREFLGVAGGALAAAMVPAPLRAAPPPRRTLRIACVGVGGMGRADLRSVASAPGAVIAALCDVDQNNLAAAAKAHSDARTFADYRRMLDEMASELDAVVVSTPDHMHGPIAIAAMERDKHVYCQKPIAHNLGDCRRMTAMAAERRLVTQMGTQIHAHKAYRTAVAVLRSGAMGKVRSAHLWVGKSWSGPAGRPDKKDPVPAHLDWDLWLGVAPERPYVEGLYHPAKWRGWRDFGGGTLGDMGCHIFDPVFTALGLGAPRQIVARGPAHGAETFAADGDVEYLFDGTPATDGPFRMRWSDGAAAPGTAGSGGRTWQPEDQPLLHRHLPPATALPGGGSYLECDHGIMVLPHWAMPRFYRDGEPLPLDVPECAAGDHYREWVAACLGDGRTSTPFAYSGPLTEAVLLGTLASVFPGDTVTWDGAAGKTSHPGVGALVEGANRRR